MSLSKLVHNVPCLFVQPFIVMWDVYKRLFDILTFCPGARKLRVWNRECEHQSTSENVDAIEQALAWK